MPSAKRSNTSSSARRRPAGRPRLPSCPSFLDWLPSLQPSVQALYVGPLKALINDQFRRLEELCAKLEIPVHRWHGDVPANQKKALRDKPSGILLITPESLESNFINFGAQVPRVYRHLSFVVIDELHSFLSNVRGVHLQSLLSRLSTASGLFAATGWTFRHARGPAGGPRVPGA